jgi:hypothetical protein
MTSSVRLVVPLICLGLNRCIAETRGSHPERGVADAQLGDDVIPLAHAVQDTRAERFLVERDRRASAVDPKLRLDARSESPPVGFRRS